MTPKILIFCLTSRNLPSSEISAGKALVLDLENIIKDDLPLFTTICLSLAKSFSWSTISCNTLASSESLVWNLSSYVSGLCLPISSIRSVSRLTLAAIERSSTNLSSSASGSLDFLLSKGQIGLVMLGLRAAPLKIIIKRITPKNRINCHGQTPCSLIHYSCLDIMY